MAACAGAATAAAVAGWLALAWLLGAVTLFLGWFFRNPRREAPRQPGVVVAPADGRVLAIEREYEPRYLKGQAIRLSIFLSIFDVHVNRVPCDGTVEGVSYQPGQFLAANRPGATLRNEQNGLMLRATRGAKVLCVQVAGLLARRIVCWASPGEVVNCGERFGLIRFGSRVDLFLPQGTPLRVSVGDRVRGGETVLAEFSGLS